MAASCRRLTTLLSRTRPIRWRHSLARDRIHSPVGNVCGSGVHVLTAPLSVSCQRLHPATTTTTTTAAPDVPVNNGNVFKRFWRWLNQGVTPEEIVMDHEEREEREALLQRVQDMYFAKPPISPDLGFYKEVFQALIKYNDRTGVETLWNVLSEMNVKPDAELVALVEPYLQKARRNAWFE